MEAKFEIIYREEREGKKGNFWETRIGIICESMGGKNGIKNGLESVDKIQSEAVGIGSGRDKGNPLHSCLKIASLMEGDIYYNFICLLLIFSKMADFLGHRA